MEGVDSEMLQALVRAGQIRIGDHGDPDAPRLLCPPGRFSTAPDAPSTGEHPSGSATTDHSPSQSGAGIARDHRTAVRQAELKRMEERRQREREKTAELEETVKERQAKQLQEALEKIRTDEFNCGVIGCRRCKPYKRTARMSVHTSADASAKAGLPRAPAPAKEVLTHKMENDTVFLYCRPDSERAHPDYRRQCMVPAPLRVAYLEKLQQLQRVPTEEEVWSVDEESQLRSALHPPLNAKQTRHNKEVAQFRDTAEWEADTHNGKVAKKRKQPEQDRNQAGPAAVEEGAQLWEIERILGGVMNQGRRFYLVKWVGWTPEHNSWEEETAFAGSNHLLQAFFKEFGKPTWKKPRVMTPEGEEHEAWLAKLEKTEYAEHKQKPVPAPVASGSGTKAVAPKTRAERAKEHEAVEQESPVRFQQGPLLATDGGEPLYEVERIIGAALESTTGKGKVMWVLVKWRGWDLGDCTWQKAATVQEAQWALNNFYADYGKPTLVNPRVLSPEGKEYEYQERVAERVKEDKKRPRPSDNAKTAEKRRGRPKKA